MTIDDMIERLNALRAVHGNLEIVLEEQTQKVIAYRDPTLTPSIMFGIHHMDRNFAYTGEVGDYEQFVIVIRI